MAVRKVAVTLPEELYELVERARSVEHRSRSEVIQEALRTHFGEPVYRPTDDERAALVAALDAARTAPVVSVDWDNSSGTNLAAYLSKSAFECPEGTDLGVRTFSFKAGKSFRPANTVAFTLLVP